LPNKIPGLFASFRFSDIFEGFKDQNAGQKREPIMHGPVGSFPMRINIAVFFKLFSYIVSPSQGSFPGALPEIYETIGRHETLHNMSRPRRHLAPKQGFATPMQKFIITYQEKS